MVALIALEKHSTISLKARAEGTRFLAWNWMRIEAYSALTRRRLGQGDFRLLRSILDLFEYIAIDPLDFPALEKTIQKHRLRSADGGHLFCLKQAKKLDSKITFVCFDDELARASASEGIPVYS